MYIYVIENLINGKMYVGQTADPISRERAHFSFSSKCPAVSKAVQKYGRENFEFSLLEKCYSQDVLNTRETFWIRELSTLAPFGYNLKEGGECGGSPSNEVREKIRKSLLGCKSSEETRRKISTGLKRSYAASGKHPNQGRVLSEPHKRKLSASRKGEKHWAYGKKMLRSSVEKMIQSKTGSRVRPRTEEGKRNISLARQEGSKLTRKIITDMKRLYAEGKISQRALANTYGMSQSQVGNILRGDQWRYE